MNTEAALRAVELIIAERAALREQLTSALTAEAAEGHTITQMVDMLISQRENARNAAAMTFIELEHVRRLSTTMPPAAADEPRTEPHFHEYPPVH